LDESATSSKTRQFLHEPTELAWHDFVDRYGIRILGWCRKQGLSREASEDITQEVLLRLHRSMRGYDRNQSFRGWLYVVTMNAITDLRTSLRSVGGQVQPEIEEFLASSEEVANFVAERDAFSVAMERTKMRCPSRHWDVFCLREYQGLDYTDIAQLTGLQAGVLMNYVSETKKIFAEEWSKLNADS
jgi:RNA polymerase sigma-70 factor (ECF subfamily)